MMAGLAGLIKTRLATGEGSVGFHFCCGNSTGGRGGGGGGPPAHPPVMGRPTNRKHAG